MMRLVSATGDCSRKKTHGKRITAGVATVAAFALAGSLTAPAFALTDVAIDSDTVAAQSSGTASSIGSDGVSLASVRLADQQTANNSSADGTDGAAMPDNPTVELPAQVSESIPDDATVVSEDLAVTSDGEVKDIETGQTVTDEMIVGTSDAPADPLAKTDGESFIPVDASDVKNAVAANGGDASASDGDAKTETGAGDTSNDANTGDTPNDESNTQEPESSSADTSDKNSDDASAPVISNEGKAEAEKSLPDNASGASNVPDVSDDGSSTGGTDGTTDTPNSNPQSGQSAVTNPSAATSSATAHVYAASLGNNQYGAHWGTYNGTSAFFEADGKLFVQQAKGVIDVSSWQGKIDWAKVKAAGVQGAIIRIGYGWGNAADKYAQRNISECKRLGIPFGVYLFSYAESAADGTEEGRDVVAKLRQLGAKPGDLTYPVFYDLENWTGTWAGHKAPTNPNVWNGAVNNWWTQLRAAGYTNLGVYSYTNYLNSALNTKNIHAKTRWVASYGARTGFPFSTNDRAWQYTSQGKVNGIEGSVDLNAFGVKTVAHSDGKNGWVGSGDNLHWYENGVAVKSHAFFDPDSGFWYWADADGSIAKSKDVFIPKDEKHPSKAGKWVRFDENRHMVKGEDNRYGGWYYFDTVTGEMAKGVRYIPAGDSGKWVYYDWTTGKMVHGEAYLNYDKEHTGWYLFDTVTGAMFHGDTYVRSSGGKWVRYDRTTGKMTKGLHRQDGAWYYFDKVTGAMAHGRTWVPEWNAWIAFDRITGRYSGR